MLETLPEKLTFKMDKTRLTVSLMVSYSYSWLPSKPDSVTRGITGKSEME